ncbi:MAG: response regulator [Patescibacteria group bacterium]
MPTQKKKKILIVEDEKPMARALELKLAHGGFDAVVAYDGEQGLDLLKTHSVDLILLDLIMPKLDGFAVLTELKQKGNKTPVIILSNLSQGGDEKRARELGALEFYIKSNTPIADIVTRVEQILKKK